MLSQLKSDKLFQLGVASGEPWPTSVVLWTRLAPDANDPQALGRDVVAVKWEVFEDENRTKRVRYGVAYARPERAHSVHVEVMGLRPEREYWYRFVVEGAPPSPMGRTKTAPAWVSRTSKLNFAFCSCAEYEDDFYQAYHFIAEDRPDFVLHLGDYIYERTYAATCDIATRHCLHNEVRAEAHTLDQYRTKYANYKLDKALQRAHQAAPWIVTWDDHEVANDYAGIVSEDDRLRTPDRMQEFARRRAAAYQAYFENMPLRLASRPTPSGSMQLYRRLAFGDLLNLHVLDERQYRTDHACQLDRDLRPAPKDAGWEGKGKGRLIRPEQCPELTDPRRTMLGGGQERWLEAGLRNSKARWDILAQGVIFAPLDQRQDPGLKDHTHEYIYTDSWSGYPRSRDRILRLFEARSVRNPIVLSGDIHAFFANQLFRDSTTGKVPVGCEFVVGSISSYIARNQQLVPVACGDENAKTVQYFNGATKGYGVMALTREAARVKFISATAKGPEPASWSRSTIGEFEVKDRSRRLTRPEPRVCIGPTG